MPAARAVSTSESTTTRASFRPRASGWTMTLRISAFCSSTAPSRRSATGSASARPPTCATASLARPARTVVSRESSHPVISAVDGGCTQPTAPPIAVTAPTTRATSADSAASACSGQVTSTGEASHPVPPELVGVLALQAHEDLVQLLRAHQDVAGLGALGRADEAAAFHQVHQPARLGEADPQLALQHRCGTELGGHHQLAVS